MAKTVFYSFYYERDVHRVQLVRNIDALEGQPLLNSQDWEKVRGRGQQAIQSWIDEQMRYKRAVVVLIGQQTASRPWVRYEIQKAWNERKPLLGVRIHGLSSMGSVDRAGPDPFVVAGLGSAGIPIFDPTRTDSQSTYAALRQNLALWSDRGVKRL
ncbi:TIR domain-containing protein [Mycolicibacterium sp. HS_4_1]